MNASWLLIRGGPEKGRFVRYIMVLGAGWAVILTLAAAFLTLSPRQYDSGFTLILPGAGSASSVNLESLGQTNSSSASPFGSHSLSPTESYKQLFQSYRLRGAVGERLGLSIAQVRPPRIRLANQTKLIYVTVRSPSPREAKRMADAWLEVFEWELDALREEEQSLRELAYDKALASFEAAVEEARAKIINFQSAYGLISIDQFQDLVAQTEAVRLDLDRANATITVSEGEIARLSSLLGMPPDQAADVMTLLSDSSFQSLRNARAGVGVRVAELSLLFGPNHPELVGAREEYAGLHAGLNARGRTLLGFERFGAIGEVYYASSDEREALIASLVQASVKLTGARKRRDALADQLETTQARVEALAVPATELDALLRDHQVAETVFASALARIDTNRTDMFASYPLTQTVETPGLPEFPATPSKKFIAFGAIAGMFLYAIGLALLWIRLPIIRALLKTL